MQIRGLLRRSVRFRVRIVGVLAATLAARQTKHPACADRRPLEKIDVHRQGRPAPYRHPVETGEVECAEEDEAEGTERKRSGGAGNAPGVGDAVYGDAPSTLSPSSSGSSSN